MKRNNSIKIFIILIFMLLVITKSSIISLTVKDSLTLCFSVLIPALFPFMVMSSLFVGNIKPKNNSLFGKVVGKALGLSAYGACVFLCGILCGYPIGAKCAAELYREGKISLSEAETLTACANNPGPLFVIGAIGVGLLNSYKFGIMLYTVQIVSSLFCAFLLKNSTYIKSTPHILECNERKLTDAVCDSVTNTLNICGFVVFFSVVNKITEPLFNAMPTLIKHVGLSITEITNGINAICNSNLLFTNKLMLIAFSLGWSGIAVHMQVESIVCKEIISIKKYYGVKVFQSVLNPGIIFLFTDMNDLIFSMFSLRVLKIIILIIPLIYGLILMIKNKKRAFTLFLKN